MILEMMRRREASGGEAARKAANVPLVGPVSDPFGSSGMSSSSAAFAVDLLEVYETTRFIHANYSIISRMEAVVRDASLG